jgi:thiol-disulfide isomerase/thioredoxin
MYFKHTITGSVLIVLLLFSSNVFSQKSNPIPIVGFSQLEEKLKSNSDTIYVINFWATWCVPCRKELPEFEKVHKNLSGDKVKVLLVSLDFPAQAEKSLKSFINANHITAPVILLNEPDANAWIDKVHPSWSGALPATLIYKKTKRLFFEKELTYQDIMTSISSLTNL